jgi:excisionase family DNA binding protein
MDHSRLLKDGLCTIPESLAFLRISRSRLYSLFASGEMQFVQLGRSRRVPRRALELYVERNLVSRSA